MLCAKPADITHVAHVSKGVVLPRHMCRNPTNRCVKAALNKVIDELER